MLLLLATACAGAPDTASLRGSATEAQQADERAVRVKALLGTGRELLRQQRARDAEPQLRAAVEVAYGFGAPWSSYRADALSELARCLLAQGRTADARAAVDEALPLLLAGEVDADQRISELETTRAEALLEEEQANAAALRFEVAAQAAARHFAELAPAQVAISLRLAQTLQRLGRRQDAKMALERSLQAARRPEVGAKLTERFARALAALYDASGEPARGRALLAELAPAAAAEARARQTGQTSSGAGAAHELVALQAEFRACYRAAAEDHADVAGRVALVLSIAADGHVSSVKADASGLPVSAVDCLKRRAALARFEPAKGGVRVLTVPVTFVKQEND